MPKMHAFRANIDTIGIRTETFLGNEYTVVPVIALVEGVLQGMQAPSPELALASEFGRYVAGWNGRPIVMNHPVVDGSPVSANSPSILEAYAFGTLFNAGVEDGKLKVEAWIDNTRTSSLGGEFASTLERINNGTEVEVSTGLYTDVENVSGVHNNEEYSAIWRNIVPDHLAILSEGLRGACNFEDGCGVRVNSKVNKDVNNFKLWQEYASDCGCGCGGECKTMAKPKSNQIPMKPLVPDPLENSIVDGDMTDDQDKQDTPDNPLVPATLTAGKKKKKTVPPKGYMYQNALRAQLGLSDSSIGLLDRDIRQLLCDALDTYYDNMELGYYYYTYVIGFTDTQVVYECYMDEYFTYSMDYSLDSGGKVTFTSEPVEVNLMTTIVPKINVDDQQEKTEMTDVPAKTTEATKPGDPAPKVEVKKEEVKTQTEVKTQAAPVVEQPIKVLTSAEWLALAPPEVRESVSSGMRLHAEKKATLITELEATGRCNFSNDQLKAFSVDQLEGLARLAAIPTYTGRADPLAVQQGLKNNRMEDLPVPPDMFAKDKAAA